MVEDFIKTKELVKSSQNILISLPQEVNGDSFCGALSLFYTLKELGKKVNLILPSLPEKFRFLITEKDIENQGRNNITISINLKRGKINKVFYEKDPQELKFYLNLKEGEIEVENVSFKEGEESPNLVITLNEKGLVFVPTQNQEKEVKLAHSSLSSTCETINNFLKSFEENLVKDRVATCLLAGLMAITQNFQNSKVGPKILREVSSLIKRGADYQMIIKNFYKTKTLAEVKLLNQVFAKLNYNKEKDAAWCSLAEEDFKNSGATSLNLAFVFETLKLNFSLPKTMFLLWENLPSPFVIKGVFYGSDDSLIKKLSENFEAVTKKNSALFLIRGVNLKEAEEKILGLIN